MDHRIEHYDRASRVYWVNDFLEAGVHAKAVPLARLRQGGSALDAGCGTGAALGLLRGAVGPNGRLIGVDISPGMIERAKHSHPDVEFISSDVTRLPLEDAQFDAAYTAFVMDLLTPSERAAAMAEFHRVLRDDGRMVVVNIADRTATPAGEFLKWAYAAFGLRAPRWLEPERSSAAQWLESAGFRDVTTKKEKMLDFVVELVVGEK